MGVKHQVVFTDEVVFDARELDAVVELWVADALAA